VPEVLTVTVPGWYGLSFRHLEGSNRSSLPRKCPRNGPERGSDDWECGRESLGTQGVKTSPRLGWHSSTKMDINWVHLRPGLHWPSWRRRRHDPLSQPICACLSGAAGPLPESTTAVHCLGTMELANPATTSRVKRQLAPAFTRALCISLAAATSDDSGSWLNSFAYRHVRQ